MDLTRGWPETIGREPVMISGHHRAAFMRLVAAVSFAIVAPGGLCCSATTPPYPFYTAQGIVHAATQTAEALAPNTIATLYGSNLSYKTDAVNSTDVVGGMLPESLDGVSIIVAGYYATLFYVSPGQVNFLVPYNLTAGPVTVVLICQGLAGPVVSIQLNATAPGMFLYNGFIIATHLSGTLISPAFPASAGEIIILYAAGLGRVTPDTTPGKIVTSAASIAAAAQMQILLAGKACPAANVLYAGLAPGFAGLYQINLIVPPLTAPNPEIRISFVTSLATFISPPALQLPLQ
jgi:uncharacterized protein (TIGR03437 family)